MSPKIDAFYKVTTDTENNQMIEKPNTLEEFLHYNESTVYISLTDCCLLALMCQQH